MVGEVTQNEIDNFKQINRNIADDFNRVFNGRRYLPTLGIAVGGIAAGIITAINGSIGLRAATFFVPVFIDYLRNSNDVMAE